LTLESESESAESLEETPESAQPVDQAKKMLLQKLLLI
jgi:hypothetical protein